jgi:Methyltransferase FkbM domain
MGEFISLSQAGQDKWVYENLPTPGTFLELGSNDPTCNSNAYSLELLGWKGILIDNDPNLVGHPNLLQRVSPFVLTDARTADFIKICADYGFGTDIDYLSLDIDGNELLVLQNLVGAGFKFKAITVEHDRYFKGDGDRDAQRAFLSQHYRLAVPDAKVYDQHWPLGAEFEDWWLSK